MSKPILRALVQGVFLAACLVSFSAPTHADSISDRLQVVRCPTTGSCTTLADLTIDESTPEATTFTDFAPGTATLVSPPPSFVEIGEPGTSSISDEVDTLGNVVGTNSFQIIVSSDGES